MASDDRGLMQVQVSYSPAPRMVDTVTLRMATGSTVADALRASGLLARHGLEMSDKVVGSAGAELGVGVWTKTRPLDHVLREADRVEIYRGLLVDPKEARRQRYRKQPRR